MLYTHLKDDNKKKENERKVSYAAIYKNQKNNEETRDYVLKMNFYAL
jgi:hypothetical protein